MPRTLTGGELPVCQPFSVNPFQPFSNRIEVYRVSRVKAIDSNTVGETLCTK